ncbi:unnamed protein product [Chironomus riparius]|uniref:Uncharacterized protein n=1 Tax=Chironomus riparius TaxID=315576 RepID=A0A9N9RJ57_9DIPT|nr:unnamed protein product [Chironomus riparius]
MLKKKKQQTSKVVESTTTTLKCADDAQDETKFLKFNSTEYPLTLTEKVESKTHHHFEQSSTELPIPTAYHQIG